MNQIPKPLEDLLDHMDNYCRAQYSDMPLVLALMKSIRGEWDGQPQPPDDEKARAAERLAQAYMVSMGIQQLAERLDDLETKLDKLATVIDSLCEEIMGDEPVLH